MVEKLQVAHGGDMRIVGILLLVLFISGCGNLEKYRVKRSEAWITESGQGVCVRDGQSVPKELRESIYKNK